MRSCPVQSAIAATAPWSRIPTAPKGLIASRFARKSFSRRKRPFPAPTFSATLPKRLSGLLRRVSTLEATPYTLFPPSGPPQRKAFSYPTAIPNCRGSMRWSFTLPVPLLKNPCRKVETLVTAISSPTKRRASPSPSPATRDPSSMVVYRVRAW